MRDPRRLLERLGYEVEARPGLLVARRRDDDAALAVYLDAGGAVRLERRRLEDEGAAPRRLGGALGEYLRRVEVVEVFLAREVPDLEALLRAWEAGELEELG